MSSRRAPAALLVGTVLLLTACTPSPPRPSLRLAADEVLETPCIGVGEVEVGRLDTAERPGCVPWGADLVFPGGQTMLLETGAAASATTDDVTVGWTNVGIYGLVAVRYASECEELEVWGRAEAVDKLREAFGPLLGHC